MVVRRCPKCHTTSDDQYGFCIKCGYEFPEKNIEGNICPLCNYQNPDEADFCVKCGSPLIFKDSFENNESSLNHIVIGQRISTDTLDMDTPHTSRLIILLGYLFSILGGLLGLIIAIYLVTRKDPVAKKHGKIQLAIFAFYLILILIFIMTGAITMDSLTQYGQMTGLENLTNITL